MATHSNEEMVLRALLVTFEKHKLPRAFNIKEKVDKGDLLNDWEVVFLQEAVDEVNHAKPLGLSSYGPPSHRPPIWPRTEKSL